MWFRHRSITVLNYILVTIAFFILIPEVLILVRGNNNQQDYIKLRSIIYGDGASWIGASTDLWMDMFKLAVPQPSFYQ
jgi:hypothetical protein